jgi:hypothetical protein
MRDYQSCARVRGEALACRIAVAFGPMPRTSAVLCRRLHRAGTE